MTVLKKPMPYPDLTSEVSMGFLLSKTIIGVDEVGRGCLAGPVVAAAAILPPDALVRLKFTPTGKRSRTQHQVSEVSLKEMKAAKSAAAKMRKQAAALKGDQEIVSAQSDSFSQEISTEAKRVFTELEHLLSVRDSKLVPEEDRHHMAEAVKKFVRGYAVAEASVLEIEKLNILYASHLAMERAVHALEETLGFRADYVLVDGHIVPRVFLGRGHPLIKGDQKSMSIACASIIAKVYRDRLMDELDAAYPGYALGEHKGYSTPQHKALILKLGATEIHRRGFRGVLPEEDLQMSFLDSEFVDHPIFEEN